MNAIPRLLLIVVCFFAAIACYVFGAPAGGVAFIIFGLVFEGLFWTGIFGKRNNHQTQPLNKAILNSYAGRSNT